MRAGSISCGLMRGKALALVICCLVWANRGVASEPCNSVTHSTPKDAKSKDPMKDHLDRLGINDRRNADAEALHNLGLHYAMGLGVKSNAQMALTKFEEAAKLDYGPAMLKTAVCYKYGIGTKANKADLASARYWFEEAVKQNVAEAQYELGMLLLNESREKARAQFFDAAINTNGVVPEAQWQMANTAPPRDLEEKYKWTYVAALNGWPEAMAKTNNLEKYSAFDKNQALLNKARKDAEDFINKHQRK